MILGVLETIQNAICRLNVTIINNNKNTKTALATASAPASKKCHQRNKNEKTTEKCQKKRKHILAIDITPRIKYSAIITFIFFRKIYYNILKATCVQNQRF